jgi:hypothetical protein
VFDYLAHPSVEYPMDPEFRTIEMICETVKKAGDRAQFMDLEKIYAITSAQAGKNK